MSFSEASLLRKFQELNNTQQSVQTLSLWLIHHRKHSHTIVSTWCKELCASPKCERKVTFIYLANDILQNSRKKGYEYMQEFAQALPEAMANTAAIADSKVRFTLERILNIWKDRKIYPDDAIDQLKSILHSTTPVNGSPGQQPPDKANAETTGSSKSRITLTKIGSKAAKKSEPAKPEPIKRKIESADEPVVKVSNKTSLREEVLKELAQNGATLQPPEPLELVIMLQELEKSASSDAVVREKIAELPAKVNDLNALRTLKDKKEANELAGTVNEAVTLLDNYNHRLQQELVNRKQTGVLLAAFIRQQQREADADQRGIDEWQRKYRQVRMVKNELQVHLESLPDLSSIEEAATLTPLPSAGDLFSS